MASRPFSPGAAAEAETRCESLEASDTHSVEVGGETRLLRGAAVRRMFGGNFIPHFTFSGDESKSFLTQTAQVQGGCEGVGVRSEFRAQSRHPGHSSCFIRRRRPGVKGIRGPSKRVEGLTKHQFQQEAINTGLNLLRSGGSWQRNNCNYNKTVSLQSRM